MDNEESYYWKLWTAIYKKFNIHGKEREDLRREITEEALGYGKSHKLFIHSEYDIVLTAMRSLLNSGECVSSPWTRGAALLEGDKRRFIHNIKKVAPESYIQEIARDKFGAVGWETLNLYQLKQLLFTVKRAARRKEPQPF